MRFLNLLAELGENSIVILSTHIVEDVSELCSRMAIIDAAEIRLEAEPLAAVARLHGRIWLRVVERERARGRPAAHFAVISTKLLGGRTVVRVLADERPSADFEPVEPALEDVYFAAMRARAPRRIACDGRAHADVRPTLRGGDVMRNFSRSCAGRCAYYLRRISTWVYFGIFVAIAFLFMLVDRRRVR